MRTEIKCTRPGVLSTTAVFDSLVDASEREMATRGIVPRTMSGIQSLKAARLHQRWLRMGAVVAGREHRVPSQHGTRR